MPFLRAALHKLAQPLTAALWINESPASGLCGSGQQSLDRELRRAGKILGFLQELLDLRQRHRTCQTVCLTDLLARKLVSLEVALRTVGKAAVLQACDALECRVNPQALDRTLNFILDVLFRAALPDGSLAVAAQSRRGWVEIRFTVPSAHGKRLAAELSSDAHPFEVKDFLFQSRELPEAARIQALVEAMEGSLSIEGTKTVLTISLALQMAAPNAGPRVPWSELESAAQTNPSVQ